MNRTTTGLCLAALLVSCSMNSVLLSSPCTLETNEVELPLPEQKEGIMTRYALKLNLLGCGDGGR